MKENPDEQPLKDFVSQSYFQYLAKSFFVFVKCQNVFGDMGDLMAWPIVDIVEFCFKNNFWKFHYFT